MGLFIESEEGYLAVLAKQVSFVTTLGNCGCSRQKSEVFSVVLALSFWNYGTLMCSRWHKPMVFNFFVILALWWLKKLSEQGVKPIISA